jgi:hypothetical protein
MVKNEPEHVLCVSGGKPTLAEDGGGVTGRVGAEKKRQAQREALFTKLHILQLGKTTPVHDARARLEFSIAWRRQGRLKNFVQFVGHPGDFLGHVVCYHPLNPHNCNSTTQLWDSGRCLERR